MARAPWVDRWRTLGERVRSGLLQHGLLPPRRRLPGGPDVVLLYNSMFGAPGSVQPRRLPEGFELSTDLRRFPEARVVVFHIPSLGRIERLRKPPGQLWAAWWMECEQHFPSLNAPEFMARFDLTISYRLSADVPTPYLDERVQSQLRSPPSPKCELAALFVSGTRETSGRTKYLEELMNHLDVHSYGSVLRNRRLAKDRGRETKLDTISRYRFTLAFENAVAEDYVTEKLYDPLIAGSVPVYYGAPNVERFVPAPDAYIDVREYRSPVALAERLSSLAADEDAYAHFLDWKRRPFEPGFRQLLVEQRRDPLARLCELVRALEGE